MAKVRVTDDALGRAADLPLAIQARLGSIVDRREEWPQVSGAKPLRGRLKGSYRIRAGDCRVVFRIDRGDVTITAVDHRKDVYEDGA